MKFSSAVVTKFDSADLEDQVVKKINEVGQDGGRKALGRIRLEDQTRCNHWRAGEYRIFGTYADGKLKL